ncbi:hypothetical protein D8674_026302 [Pyrus ussuriensis x Pyrus communis]|uniref:Uncharacterized protein n=1 Tax=Pyrus ussuriensis x Pyrus communis TaxID=2448454 RepID=A0A5N5I7J6_9ROSA|nr:hypothetical protein D8674_026302 [Pyrus ussuriensis x Pyrus communis]
MRPKLHQMKFSLLKEITQRWKRHRFGDIMSGSWDAFGGLEPAGDISLKGSIKPSISAAV